MRNTFSKASAGSITGAIGSQIQQGRTSTQNNCYFCKRTLTDNDENATLNRSDCTFSVNTDDKVCESCEAKHRAASCSRAIKINLSYFKDIVRNGYIECPGQFLESKLVALKAKWKAEFIKGIEMPKYSYWAGVFDREVDKMVVDACEMQKEKTASDRVNY